MRTSKLRLERKLTADRGAILNQAEVRLLNPRAPTRVVLVLPCRRRLRYVLGRCDLTRQRLGQAEVQHLHEAVGRHLDVRRLQVAVDDPFPMGGIQRRMAGFNPRQERTSSCGTSEG